VADEQTRHHACGRIGRPVVPEGLEGERGRLVAGQVVTERHGRGDQGMGLDRARDRREIAPGRPARALSGNGGSGGNVWLGPSVSAIGRLGRVGA
jgi:hypothetical protein